MSVRGETITKERVRPRFREAVEQAAATIDRPGLGALRALLHAGVSARWQLMLAAPVKEMECYETEVRTLRDRWEMRTDRGAHPVASAEYREMEAEVADFLKLCAARSGTQWLEPVEAIAAYGISLVRGAALRWLADCDDEAMLVVLDDLVATMVTKAIEV
ncbi:hypothetical protein [Nocardia sp. CNY236]|uniref:hypothetical protein n=1 Tax=Nocardia sp. CNY236 TaxID=1169152 RepID=UPI00068757EF|nr:hypothetical protein [Nocardia sp. CNY236]